MMQNGAAGKLIERLQSNSLDGKDRDFNTPERTLSFENDFVDMSKVNILTSLHPYRKTNRKILKKHNPRLVFSEVDEDSEELNFKKPSTFSSKRNSKND